MSTHSQSSTIDFAQAVRSPSSVFATPEEVLELSDLSQAQKVEILQQWQYDASSVAVAEEEGMDGGQDPLLQRVVHALHQVTGGVDVEHSGPTKQSSL